jgi:hypothetical protein
MVSNDERMHTKEEGKMGSWCELEAAEAERMAAQGNTTVKRHIHTSLTDPVAKSC